ncbi:MAG TPA: MerR family transcriptional regulator [Actinomycetota bacterium]|nr:MerR family transcriptional regulator [Actinomycetota bacterium]
MSDDIRTDLPDDELDELDELDERALYVISVAAELAGVHPQTLRIYERKGLLSPQRSAGNSRRYSERDIAQLRRIQRMTQSGINLEGVKRIIELQTEIAEMRREMQELQTEIDARGPRGDLIPIRDLPRLPHTEEG